jgi:hypothetical protein
VLSAASSPLFRARCVGMGVIKYTWEMKEDSCFFCISPKFSKELHFQYEREYICVDGTVAISFGKEVVNLGTA